MRLRSGLPLRSQMIRGDPAALTAVYERHHQALYRYCRSILRDEEEAWDALQSTMAKAVAALSDEQRDFEVRPWLFRIAHNEAISRLRRRREIADPDTVAEASVDALAQTVEDRERLAHLQTDLQDLHERQRAALVLRELCGLSHQEIAGVLDSTPRAIKQTIFDARTALQECAEGREMGCGEVQRALSDGDRRVLRARRLRAHVRSCRSCRRFQASLEERPADLAALAPALPTAAGAALLARLLSGVASGTGVATGGGVAASVATKAAVVVAATAALAGTTTAVRSAVEPSHRPAPAPARAAPASRETTPPARATPAHLASPAASAHRAPTSAPTHRAHGGHARRSAQHGNSQAAHAAAPGQAEVASGTGRGKSPLAPGHLKAAKPATPKTTSPAKTRPTHPTHPTTPAGPPTASPATNATHGTQAAKGALPPAAGVAPGQQQASGHRP